MTNAPEEPRAPGWALLEAVAVMDRLRSPGGCPWDAEQTHQSLAPYLLEEAYEAYQTRWPTAISDGLRDELGDVLLQVLFHARVASEEPAGWDIDDVAAGLVAKLVRRHPHVFADTEVNGSADVEANWDAIKAVEKPSRSVADGVPLATAGPCPGRQAAVARHPGEDLVTARPTRRRSCRPQPPRRPLTPARRSVAELLLAAVTLARASGVDPEAALRRRALRCKDELNDAGCFKCGFKRGARVRPQPSKRG